MLDNAGLAPVTLQLKALGYTTRTDSVRLQPREQRTLPWSTDYGWYDVEIIVEQDTTFRRRLVGRVEDGTAGLTG